MTLRSPFPYPGGKSKVSAEVWQRFGDVPRYVEPFFGSGSVLLGRPGRPRIEVVNDSDGFICNFYRSVKTDPKATAEWADHPVNESDLHARHLWLLDHKQSMTDRLMIDPDYFDPKIAGWWVWGLCATMLTWCSGDGPWIRGDGKLVKKDPGVCGPGITRSKPFTFKPRGIHCLDDVFSAFDVISARIRRVIVCCGDWSRVVQKESKRESIMTGIFLDPPYGEETGRSMGIYSSEDGSVASDVLAWCMAHGSDPLKRIALCGYDGEHNVLEDFGWRVHRWTAHGGFSVISKSGNMNKNRERIWFSPACLDSDTAGLMDMTE